MHTITISFPRFGKSCTQFTYSFTRFINHVHDLAIRGNEIVNRAQDLAYCVSSACHVRGSVHILIVYKMFFLILCSCKHVEHTVAPWQRLTIRTKVIECDRMPKVRLLAVHVCCLASLMFHSASLLKACVLTGHWVGQRDEFLWSRWLLTVTPVVK